MNFALDFILINKKSGVQEVVCLLSREILISKVKNFPGKLINNLPIGTQFYVLKALLFYVNKNFTEELIVGPESK